MARYKLGQLQVGLPMVAAIVAAQESLIDHYYLHSLMSAIEASR